jgi:hypothetical protein
MNLGKNDSTSAAASKIDADIIRIMKTRGKIKVGELCAMLNISKSSGENAMKRMQEKRLAHVVKEKGHNVWYYGSSQVIEKQRFKPSGIYKGENWQPSIARPGCEDFLKCPSRYGDKLVPHRPMMHGMTSSIRQPSQFDR